MTTAAVLPRRLSRANGWLWAALALAAALVALNWVGYDGADDRSYALGAEAWLRHFPAVGADHWATRHTVVLPVALSLAIFGRHEFALAVPSVLYFFGFLFVNHHYASRFLGARAGTMLTMLLAVTPAFVVQASYINIDIAEAFFASLSFWLFIAGTEEGRASRLFWSGAAAGLSFLTRETSAVLPLFFAVCFLLDKAPARRNYLYLALGFIAPIGLEMIYFGVTTGDLLHRYRMDAHHDTVSRAQELKHTANTGAALDRQGNLSVSVWADPFLMLFASQKFGLLFWLAIPAAVWAFRTRALAAVESLVVRRAARLMLLWIAFLSLAFPILYLVPRYYIVAAWAGVLLIAYTADVLLPGARRRAVIAAIAALVAVNALSLYVENTNPRFAERALVGWLRQNPGTVVRVDPDMARRSDILLSFAGLDGRAVAGAPQAGDLFVYSPRNLELCKEQGLCKPKLHLYDPKPGWEKIAAVNGSPRAIGSVLRALHVARLIPAQVMQKLETPAPGITIYRVR
jgi:4-amino-4-deoxy-L-arabinose transferase-like glycosyltransferase